MLKPLLTETMTMISLVRPACILTIALLSQRAWADNDFCQTAKQTIEQNADNFWQYGSYSNEYDEEKYHKAYDEFEANITAILKNKRSLQCDWQNTQGIITAILPDKKLRALSWDTATGGTLHEFSGLLQTQDNQGDVLLTNKLPDADYEFGNIANISQMNLANQPSRVYVIRDYSIASTAMRGESLRLYQLNNGRLKPIKLIQAKQLTNSLGFSYSHFDIAKDWQDRDLIQIDNKKKQISIPVVIEGTDNDVGLGRVTNKRIVYQYDGRLFRRIKN